MAESKSLADYIKESPELISKLFGTSSQKALPTTDEEDTSTEDQNPIASTGVKSDEAKQIAEDARANPEEYIKTHPVKAFIPDRETPQETPSPVPPAPMEEPTEEEQPKEEVEPKPHTLPPLPRSRPANIPTEGKPGFTQEELTQAQHQKDMASLANRLGMAGETIGTALSRTQPIGTKGFEANIKAADDYVNNLKDKLTMDKFDPNSQSSQFYRGMMKEKFGVTIGDNVSASDIEKAFPVVAKASELEVAKQMQYLQAKMVQDAKQESRQDSKQEKKEGQLNKDIRQFGEALDPTKGRAGLFGDQYGILQRGERLKQLVNKAKGGLNLTPAESEELALGTARLISGAGGTSRSQIQALVPHSLTGESMKAIQWLTNKPTGSQQQEFVQRTMNLIDREQETARNELEKTINKRAKSYSHLSEDKPEEYNDILNTALESIGKGKAQQEAAKTAPIMPKSNTVTQGGHTYTLNPTTGKYE